MSALLDLAWASMSELSIVAKLAAKCRKRGRGWARGDKGEIREIVKDSRPPRGFKKKRLDAVIEEISRQEDVSSKRARSRPIDWSNLHAQSIVTRRNRVFELVAGKTEFKCCLGYQKWQGHNVFLVRRDYYERIHLYILHPDGGKRIIKFGDGVEGHTTILGLVLYVLGRKPGLLKQAVMNGWRIEPDFCLGRTVIHRPAWEDIVLPWVTPKEAKEEEHPPYVCRSRLSLETGPTSAPEKSSETTTPNKNSRSRNEFQQVHSVPVSAPALR